VCGEKKNEPTAIFFYAWFDLMSLRTRYCLEWGLDFLGWNSMLLFAVQTYH
jgi:hypothetical protein